MPSDRYEARRRQTKIKLSQALERLRNRLPNNPKVQKKLQQGDNLLTVRTLALEAGVSHNPIYTNHREFIEELRTIQRRGKNMPQTLKTPSDKIAELRGILESKSAEHEREKQQLVYQKRLLATENASLVARIQRAERRFDETKRKLDKLQNKNNNRDI